MKIDEMVCCSWHKPTNAIVETSTGRIVPRKTLRAIPDSPEKDLMMGSGGMCDPCAFRFISGSRAAKKAPLGEGLAGENFPGSGKKPESEQSF